VYTIVHAVIGYLVLLFVVRILSRRPGGQLTPFEFVIVFLIGGVIILATVGDDKSVTNCVCAILTIGLMHRLTAGMRAAWRRFSIVSDGVPLVLLNRGRWHTEAMDGMRLKSDDVMAAARTKGLRDLKEIRYAILERVGTISILTEEDSRKAKAERAGDPANADEAEDGLQTNASEAAGAGDDNGR
jgi:uncharacterized membrane protein YcaP (DUF421 family)